ncbi:MAG: RHS domain-containing protein, partial [Myxococcales bacterium]|nr:RHS domain-containing protein [Myxococcales bacterium]
YDALGRRIAKRFLGRTTRWLWDGDVPLHEWTETDEPAPPTQLAPESTTVAASRLEIALGAGPPRGPPPPGLITWVFMPDSFAPAAKLVDGEAYSIVCDHLGAPVAMFDTGGERVWAAEYDARGQLRDLECAGDHDRHACPFRWPGQYEDAETGLYYNRFRYYDPQTGVYISRDRTGLGGGRALYAYPRDPLLDTDPLGLNNVSTGAGRDHVTYRGIKNGKYYTGYASAPSSLGLTPNEIVSYRYGGDFSNFGGNPPRVVYDGTGVDGKRTARGLEQHFFEQDVKTHGRTNVANAQNPVGPNNKNRTKYKKNAKKHLDNNPGCG